MKNTVSVYDRPDVYVKGIKLPVEYLDYVSEYQKEHGLEKFSMALCRIIREHRRLISEQQDPSIIAAELMKKLPDLIHS